MARRKKIEAIQIELPRNTLLNDERVCELFGQATDGNAAFASDWAYRNLTLNGCPVMKIAKQSYRLWGWVLDWMEGRRTWNQSGASEGEDDPITSE